MKKRQKLFIQYYTDRTDKETCGNATKSALKAGYSASRAASQGSSLLKNPTISQQIAIIEKNEADKYKATRDSKIELAWKNYINATSTTEKKFWWREHGELSGDYVQRVESKNENIYKEETEQQISDAIRDQLRNIN